MKEVRVSGRRRVPVLVIEAVASSRLAIVLVLVLILFSAVGAMLPQEGLMSRSDIAGWQEAHPTITVLLEPVGLFRVFSSWPFLATVVLLALNILTCTILLLVREGGLAAFRGPRALRRTGFLLVHLCVIGILAGGFVSASFRLEGLVVLTEGQSFKESRDAYLQLVEGPLRAGRPEEFVTRLENVRIKYVDGHFPVDVASDITLLVGGETVASGTVRINDPFTFRGVSLTQDRTGFSPRLEILQRCDGRVQANSFIALQTTGPERDREYRDFLPLPFFGNRIIISLYPSHSRVGDEVRKTGDEPENPLLVVETTDECGKVSERQYLPLGGRITVGEYVFGFTELRRWSAFRVAEDPGYIPVMISLWLGVAGLVLRYAQDLWRWFGRGSGACDAS
jgi:hypothetical protein